MIRRQLRKVRRFSKESRNINALRFGTADALWLAFRGAGHRLVSRRTIEFDGCGIKRNPTGQGPIKWQSVSGNRLAGWPAKAFLIRSTCMLAIAYGCAARC